MRRRRIAMARLGRATPARLGRAKASRLGRAKARGRLRLVRQVRMVALAASLALLGGALAGCSGPILANPVSVAAPATSATPSPIASADPRPVVFPRDDGPHHRLTEWWYYTGHLVDEAGRRYGFEFVVFRAERGGFPVAWASHLAVTDEAAGAFHYAQRSEIGPQVDQSPSGPTGPTGFDLALTGGGPATAGTTATPATPGASAVPGARAVPGAPSPPAWRMTGGSGTDRLTASLGPLEAIAAGTPGGLGLDLGLSGTRPPVLHGREGWIDFGPAGGSYYDSRTRLTAVGTLDLNGHRLRVSGSAWFDHQWGDFIAVGGGGWDWFAINLADGTDLMLSIVRAADGSTALVYGTLVGPDGDVRTLDQAAFTVRALGSWRSPRSGVVYPSGWVVELPGEKLRIQLMPSVADQELDTRATTGVVYWEGSQIVQATRAGRPLGGEAYVELTGYGPTSPGLRPAPGRAPHRSRRSGTGSLALRHAARCDMLVGPTGPSQNGPNGPCTFATGVAI